MSPDCNSIVPVLEPRSEEILNKLEIIVAIDIDKPYGRT